MAGHRGEEALGRMKRWKMWAPFMKSWR